MQVHNTADKAQSHPSFPSNIELTGNKPIPESSLQKSPLQPAFQYNASLDPIDPVATQAHSSIAASHSPSSQGASLRLKTDLWHQESTKKQALATTPELPPETNLRQMSSSLPFRTPSVKSTLSPARNPIGSLSPSSTQSSPRLGPFSDITPLPSPLVSEGSPAPWRKMARPSEEPRAGSVITSTMALEDEEREQTAFPRMSPPKRKAYGTLNPPVEGSQTIGVDPIMLNTASHARNRSQSEYVPPIHVPRRAIAVSGSQTPTSTEPSLPPDQLMHREEYLAEQRGLTPSATKPPTPPGSHRGAIDSSDAESPPSSPSKTRGPVPLQYEAPSSKTGELKHWSAIRQLGKGTFSTVMLATSDVTEKGISLLETESQASPKSLVAVKICEHGPLGGADEKRIESSLKRELEILQSVNHPSLVHLKAVSTVDQRTLLFLNYCAGGDLFELASLKLELLTSSLVQRMFAELVSAVYYLHLQYIVHRDIKLENVLVNLPASALPLIKDWQHYPHPIITLTDLGLGRWIPRPPDSPLLDTRCGSEDYAAPELLMGQEYDGRATDAWALGVLLYAIMEGRLPFDPLPESVVGRRKQSPRSHRIARCEWRWIRWGDDDGEWDVDKGKELEGGRACVEGLLKRARTRMSLEKAQQLEWVRDGILIDEGLKREEGDEEI